MIIFDLSAAIDHDLHKGFTISDLEMHLARGDLLDVLKAKFGVGLGQGILDSEPNMRAWFLNSVMENLGGVRGRERRKYGIEHNGITMLLSLVAEMIQQRQGIRFDP